MKIELDLGDEIRVTLGGTDGEFVIRFGEKAVSVTADMPDSSGREGVIYEERWGEDLDEDGNKLYNEVVCPDASQDPGEPHEVLDEERDSRYRLSSVDATRNEDDPWA